MCLGIFSRWRNNARIRSAEAEEDLEHRPVPNRSDEADSFGPRALHQSPPVDGIWNSTANLNTARGTRRHILVEEIPDVDLANYPPPPPGYEPQLTLPEHLQDARRGRGTPVPIPVIHDTYRSSSHLDPRVQSSSAPQSSSERDSTNNKNDWRLRMGTRGEPVSHVPNELDPSALSHPYSRPSYLKHSSTPSTARDDALPLKRSKRGNLAEHVQQNKARSRTYSKVSLPASTSFANLPRQIDQRQDAPIELQPIRKSKSTNFSRPRSGYFIPPPDRRNQQTTATRTPHDMPPANVPLFDQFMRSNPRYTNGLEESQYPHREIDIADASRFSPPPTGPVRDV